LGARVGLGALGREHARYLRALLYEVFDRPLAGPVAVASELAEAVARYDARRNAELAH